MHCLTAYLHTCFQKICTGTSIQICIECYIKWNPRTDKITWWEFEHSIVKGYDWNYQISTIAWHSTRCGQIIFCNYLKRAFVDLIHPLGGVFCGIQTQAYSHTFISQIQLSYEPNSSYRMNYTVFKCVDVASHCKNDSTNTTYSFWIAITQYVLKPSMLISTLI